jgi:hypothetical protein
MQSDQYGLDQLFSGLLTVIGRRGDIRWFGKATPCCIQVDIRAGNPSLGVTHDWRR